MAYILAVDDEKDVLILVKNILSKDGHQVEIKDNPKKLDLTKLPQYDLIILDVMMPSIDGISLCKEIRDIVDCPILFLTAKTMEEDVMNGLLVGADDYIKKPFGVGELRARVLAHLRREQREKHSYLLISGVKFNLSAKCLQIEEDQISLTKSEYAICEFLGRNHGQVFSKEMIYERVFGFEGESDNLVVVEHIKNIRAKLLKYNSSPIETVWGVGYKWV